MTAEAMTSVYDRIAEARRTLVGAGLNAPDAAIDAEVLARHALGWDRARLLAYGRDRAPQGFAEQFTPLIERRARHEPVAFITGHREFWGLDFEVSHDVLIPRPETELIIEGVCERRGGDARVRRIVDVGTGSGCLAIVLAREFPDARVIATDISAAALAIAAKNAARHSAAGSIMFVETDLLDAISGPIDVIVSNPPYVPSNVQLSPDIVNFEPAVALYSGIEGLSALECLIASARACVADDGLLVVEFGFGQDDRVEALAAQAGWRDVSLKEDLQGIPRVAVMSA
jgi:release factor glutamine methyltransferase